MDPVEFGSYLKELRKKKGLTLDALGKAVDMSQPFLSQIENGKRGIPTPDQLYRLCRPLDVTHAHLMIKAGHMKEWMDFGEELEPLPSEDEWLETELNKIQEQSLKLHDLANIILNPKTNYKGSTLSDKDRERLLSLLELLFQK